MVGGKWWKMVEMVLATAFTFERLIDYYRFTGYSLQFRHIDGLTNDRVFYPGVSLTNIVGINGLNKEDG